MARSGIVGTPARLSILTDTLPWGLGHGALTLRLRFSWLIRPGIDLHSGGPPGREDYALRHLIDVDAYRNTLGKPHPGKDRVDRGDPLFVGLRIGTLMARAMLSTWPRMIWP
jgi:hypothetical protein